MQGNLTIQNVGVDSLPKLSNLRKVTGNVLIKSTGLDSLPWLLNLDTIGGNFTIRPQRTVEVPSRAREPGARGRCPQDFLQYPPHGLLCH